MRAGDTIHDLGTCCQRLEWRSTISTSSWHKRSVVTAHSGNTCTDSTVATLHSASVVLLRHLSMSLRNAPGMQLPGQCRLTSAPKRVSHISDKRCDPCGMRRWLESNGSSSANNSSKMSQLHPATEPHPSTWGPLGNVAPFGTGGAAKMWGSVEPCSAGKDFNYCFPFSPDKLPALGNGG